MATLVLSTVGSAAGSALGGPVGGAVGRVIGAAAGALADRALFGGGNPRFVEGPRLKELDGLASTEGAAIPRVYGRARVGGQLIWATRFEEVANTTIERTGGRGGKSTGGGKTVRTSYAYFANLAIGLCEGPIAFVRRVWADGRELDLTTLVMRVHRGDETQPPDPLIVAKEGADNAPAYRGLAYVVFERLALESFGNRVPQFSFEVVRPVDGLASMVRAVCLIPGASEFAYEPSTVTQAFGFGVTRPENRHQLQAGADVIASLDALQALCPNLARVSLVVAWFGDDLRCGQCTIAPRVDRATKVTSGAEWSAAGLTRPGARVVSQAGGAAAYGGTPSDVSVVRLIQELKARGLEVVLYPFVMMDVAAGNALPDPGTGAAPQPAYPWRGRITCDPAPSRQQPPALRVRRSTGGYVQGSTINLTGIGGGAATINLGGVSRPIADNTYTLGDASHRWSQLYAATSTINTSDAREKTAPSEIPDALLDAILSVPIGQDQWLDSVARKGAGKARIHFGPMAQDVRDAILAKGLDPERYALFCKDQKLAAFARTRRVSRPVPPEIVEVETIVVEGGRAIRRQVAAERPVTRRVTVEDESGAPVMRAVPGASTLEPLTIEIPATEEVEETYEALEPVPGEFVYGLRLEQFYALLGLAIRRRAGL